MLEAFILEILWDDDWTSNHVISDVRHRTGTRRFLRAAVIASKGKYLWNPVYAYNLID